MAEQLSAEKSKNLFKIDIFDKLSAFYKTTTGKTYTIMGISVVILALLLLVAFRPTLKTIFELNTKIKQYAETAEVLEKKHRDLQELTREYNTLVSEGGNHEQIVLLDQAVMPSSPDIDVLFDDINAYAVENSVIIEQIEASTENIPIEFMFETISAKQLTLSVNGTDSEIYNMIADLYDYPRPLVVTAVSLSQSETAENQSTEEDQQGSATDIYRGSIQFYTFFYYITPVTTTP